jgi:hypothetical protein
MKSFFAAYSVSALSIPVVLLSALTAHAQEPAKAETPASASETPAEPKPPQECIGQHRSGQLARRERDLKRAHELLSACSERCPEAIQQECAALKDDVHEELPKVVLRMVGPDGKPLAGLQLTIDGQPVVVPEDGIVTVNPGLHALRVVVEGETHETQKLLTVGSKIEFPDSVAPPPVAATQEPAEDDSSVFSEVPVASWAMGTVGLGALGFGIYSLVASKGAEDCAPTCTNEQVDDINSQHTVGVISTIAGGVLLGGAGAYWYFTADDSEPSDGDVGVGFDGSQLFVSGSF